MLLRITLPPNNERGPRYAAQGLAAMLAAMSSRCVELWWTTDPASATIAAYMRIDRGLASLAERQLAAAYPEAKLERLPDNALDRRSNNKVCPRWLRLSPEVLSLPSVDAFEDRLSRELNDPLAGLLASLADEGGAPACVKLYLRAPSRGRLRRAERLLDGYRRSRSGRAYGRWVLELACSPRWRLRLLGKTLLSALTKGHTPQEEAGLRKLQATCFEVRIEIGVESVDRSAAKRKLDRITAAMAVFAPATDVCFKPAARRDRGALMTVEEVALLWHPRTPSVQTERIASLPSREFEPPARLPSPRRDNAVVLGRVLFRKRSDLVGLSLDDRRRHLYVCGKTGTGKSTLLLNMVTHDIRSGHGLALIDPHGDLIDEAVERIHRSRTNDVVLFDPASESLGPAATFNPLACPDPSRRPLVAASVQAALAKVFELTPADAPRLLYILQNVLLALVEQEHATLLDVPRMLVEEPLRRRVVARLSNATVRRFWVEEFSAWNPRYRDEAIAPIQNKIGQLLADERLQRVFGEPRGSLDLRHAMDSGKIVLVNLSYGRLGEPAAKLLGALVVSQIQIDSLARADTPEADRRDFCVYADEFQGYAGVESREIGLSQLRKFRTFFVLSNQLLGQLVQQSPSLAATVFGNVGSLCVFQVGHDDAVKLADELGGDIAAEDLIGIPKHTAAVRLLVDGEPTKPFTIRTLPPPPVRRDHALRETIEKVTRNRARSPKGKAVVPQRRSRDGKHARPSGRADQTQLPLHNAQ